MAKVVFAPIVIDMDIDPSQVDALFLMIAKRISGPGLLQFLEDRLDPYVRQRVSMRFAGEGDDVTGAWLPLTKATEKMRAAAGYPPAHPINVRSGEMRNWLLKNESQMKTFGGDALLIYPNVLPPGDVAKKVITAQLGHRASRTPPRPVVGLNRFDLAFTQAQLTKWILGG